MSKIYPSKIGFELVIPLGLILGAVFILMIINRVWPGVIIMLGIVIFIIHPFLTTSYTIQDEKLLVKSGLLHNSTIAIHSIHQINETRNPLSSPATSLDRLEIGYNRYDSVLGSPKDKQGFINDLLSLNPEIEVKYHSK